MGFSRSFRPPKEVVQEYMDKLKSTYPDYIELHKTEICTNILVECFNYPYDTSINIETFMMRLKWDLEKLEQMIKADTFLLHKEIYDSDGYFHVAGWEFNKNEPEVDKNRVYNICLKEITLWAATLKTNYFENQDNYYTKMEKIEENLDYFTEMITQFTIFDFMGKFSEYEDKADDEDEQLENVIEQKDIDNEFLKVVNEHFDELVGNE